MRLVLGSEQRTGSFVFRTHDFLPELFRPNIHAQLDVTVGASVVSVWPIYIVYCRWLASGIWYEFLMKAALDLAETRSRACLTARFGISDFAATC
jgi:hypothetical protein